LASVFFAISLVAILVRVRPHRLARLAMANAPGNVEENHVMQELRQIEQAILANGKVDSQELEALRERLVEAERALRRRTHDTIRRVTVDVDARQNFNTAISAMRVLVNDLYTFTSRQEESPTPQAAHVARETLEALIVLVSPFAPHTAEELWEQFGHPGTLAAASWPTYDPEAAKAEEVVIPVQVNGKVRGRLTVSPEATDEELEELALADAGVRSYTQGKTVRKVVIAKGRLVSLVVN